MTSGNGILAGKVALITGASSGIGKAAAILFAGEGARLAVTGRSPEKLESTEIALREAGAEYIALAGNLNDASFRESVAAGAHKAFGRLDILVNAAGIIGSGDIQGTTLEFLDNMMKTNLTTVFHLLQLCVPHLKETRGAVVNVSSVTGTRAFPGVLAYCVSKAAVDQLTRCTALELAPLGIRVNAINPGVVLTNLHKASGMSEEKYAAFLEHSKTTHPLGRVGKPEEAAELILFLASDKAAWITGDTIAIDGGRAQTCAR
jgi:NAD(P)-dependent dehydrogenase (short-subunit alcohol dehydrogenase family)